MQLFALLPLAALAVAQSSSSSSSASSTSTASAGPATQTVDVGKDGALRFVPEVISAPTGGQIVFRFYPQDHSVTQGNFDDPCHHNANGINSGFVPVSNATAEVKTFTITVANQDPIWLYCAQARHCENGMVAVINPSPTGNQQLSVYRTNATNVTKSDIPASVRGGVLTGVSGTNSSTSTNGSSASGTATSSASPSSSSKSASSEALTQGSAWIVALFAAVAAAVATV